MEVIFREDSMRFISIRELDEAFRAIEDFETLASAEAVISRLAGFLRHYGFTSFLITGLPTQRERLEPHILLNNWPEDWYCRYTEANHYRWDPCVRHCFETIEPFAWNELPEALVADAAPRRIMHEAAEFGLKQGLCVPLHDLFGFQSVVTMAGLEVDLTPESRRIVHLASVYAYAAADRTAGRKRTHAPLSELTDRECEVLRWTAAGKTAWDIGQILGICEFTVKDHLRNVRRKFGTATTVQSVVEALRRRQIRL
jgi:LuxR family quorum sensing-dependent transcriptional regulator